MTQVFSNPIILAIDTNSENEAFDLVNELKENIGAVKLGLEYFHSYGPEGVRKIKNLNIPIFLDLKLHDIPITVKKSIETLIDLEPTILNVHALGGEEMMKVAAQVILDNNCSTKDGNFWLYVLNVALDLAIICQNLQKICRKVQNLQKKAIFCKNFLTSPRHPPRPMRPHVPVPAARPLLQPR